MLRAFIVDDEPPARARLRQLLGEAGGVLVVGEAGDAIEARTAIAEIRPDVVFLDIDMPQESGTALAGSLPEPRPYVVFATAFDHYALDAFAVDATDYLVKPITRARLASTLTRVRERLSRRSDLERELRDASAAQAWLLPRSLPATAGYDSAALTLPARGVGGDFFLGQPIGANAFAFALGDVSGKGTPAGLIAASLQARLEAAAGQRGVSAGTIVADVNRALCERSDAARFATLVYLELDVARATLTIVNAGHLPALVVGVDGQVRAVAANAPALGILPDARYVPETVALNPGDVVLLYSDGVTEALDPDGVEFEDVRLQRIVKAMVREPAAAIAQSVLDGVRHHVAGGTAVDDVTVLVIKRSKVRDEGSEQGF